jgi:hypothetical protein
MMHREIYRDTSSRAVIDVAIGVLVGLRHCSERQAFNELAAAVRETGVGLGSISRALVTRASGATQAFDPRLNGVVDRWDVLLADRKVLAELA